MNRISSKVAASLLLALGLGAASAAQAAGNVSFFVGVSPAVRYNQPVYVQPQPVYVAPQVTYYEPPVQYVQSAPVYVRPAPVFYSWEARREWERAEWRRAEWRRHHGHHDNRGYGYGYN